MKRLDENYEEIMSKQSNGQVWDWIYFSIYAVFSAMVLYAALV